MKALEKSIYAQYDVCLAFNKIILSGLESYSGTKKQQLKSFLEDLQNGGCMSGMISEFIYHADCKEFYIKHLEDLENIREEMEDSLGETVKNRHRLNCFFSDSVKSFFPVWALHLKLPAPIKNNGR